MYRSLLIGLFLTLASQASAECDGTCTPDGEACQVDGKPCCETGSSCYGFNFYKKCQTPPLCLREWYDCTSGMAGNVPCCEGMECVLGDGEQYECQHIYEPIAVEGFATTPVAPVAPVTAPVTPVSAPVAPVAPLTEAAVIKPWSPADEGYLFFANMTNAGVQDPTAPNYQVAAKAYIKADCAGPHLCIYVMAEPGVALSSTEGWFKDYTYSTASIPFVAPGLTYREENGVIVGWSGCVTVPFDKGATGLGVEIHANWGLKGSNSLGNTASTGKSGTTLVTMDYPVCLKPAFVEGETAPVATAPQATPVAAPSAPTPTAAGALGTAPTPVTSPVTAPIPSPVAAPVPVTAASLTDKGWTPLFSMYNAGNPDTKSSNYQLAGKAWYKYDCAARLICWLVMAEPGLEISGTEAWFKDYGRGNSAIEAVAPGITFKMTNNVRTGWTGCFYEPLGATGSIEVHANYGVAGSGKLGNTMSTGKSNTLGGYATIDYDHHCVGLAPTCAAAGAKCNGSMPCCNGRTCPTSGNKVCPSK
ncbi:hypothetical protein FisN_7Lh401 [Fistulifera solaris]|uniref:VWFD domain-containing protein n=1 Tax=Fistulifera solaris TaxID=1519565 RepID=A0A1Z5JBB3_FISSO|nr:hypothetical protein FisN_7Lh401 [Fistulifera solaris]|eukprot:GAX11293.1 hypothetical protein FisN_7Lh401 [Fistulifera solaris]